jgi:hypothetical protein
MLNTIGRPTAGADLDLVELGLWMSQFLNESGNGGLSVYKREHKQLYDEKI